MPFEDSHIGWLETDSRKSIEQGRLSPSVQNHKLTLARVTVQVRPGRAAPSPMDFLSKKIPFRHYFFDT
jgi:hypothetical protein